MKRRREEAPEAHVVEYSKEGRKQLHMTPPEAVGVPAAFEEFDTITFEAKSKPLSAAKTLRHFFNRTDVCRANILRALSSEAWSNVFQLMEQAPLPESKVLLRIAGKLHLQSKELEQLFQSKYINSFREQAIELVCSNLEKAGLVDAQEKERRCKLCRTLLIGDYLPRYGLSEKSGQHYIALLGYYIANAADRKIIVEECKRNFTAYLTSQRKFVSAFFRQLLRIPEAHPVLEKLVTEIIELRIGVEEQLEQYLCGNLSAVLEALHIEMKPEKVLSFLCLKIKSLSKQTRKAALESLIRYPQLQPETVKMMIVKDVLDRTVDHCRGIFLHLLEDEYCQIRILTLQCLRTFSLYLDRGQLKQIMFYMVNDNNERVRIQALRALIGVAHNYSITGDDLSTMLMCLKDRRAQFRYYVYRLVGIVSIVNEEDFLNFVEKLIKTLKIFKEDKIHLYTALRSLGSRSKNFILSNVKQLLEIADLEDQNEPSWKNILYKARVILVANCFESNYYEGIKQCAAQLPSYFLKHFEYIRDVQPYAFERNLTRGRVLENIREMDLSTRSNRLQFLKSHVVLWDRSYIEQENDSLEDPVIEEQYLRRLFQLGCFHYELEALALTGSLGYTRSEGLLKQIMHESTRLKCVYQCEDFTLFFDVSRLNCLLAILIASMNPVYLNRSRLSETVIAIARYLPQMRLKYSEHRELHQLLGRVELVSRKAMKSLSLNSSLTQQMQEAALILAKTSAFNTLFETLKQLTRLQVRMNVLRLSLVAQDSNTTQICLRIEIQSYGDRLHDYHLKVERKHENAEYVRVLDGDRVDTLEDSHLTVFTVQLIKRGNISRVTGLKKVDPQQSEMTQDLLRLLGMENQQSIEMDSIVIE